jgi:hypothetical protein
MVQNPINMQPRWCSRHTLPHTQKQIHAHLRRLVHHGHAELRALHTRMARAIQRSEQDMCAVDGVCLRRVARIGRTNVGGGGVQGVQFVALGVGVLDGS